MKIKCGKILVKSHKENKVKKPNRTFSQSSQNQDVSRQRKQTDWPSNRLMNNQMENTFHAMRNELAELANNEFDNAKPQSHNLTRKEYNALERFSKTSSLVFKKGDKTTCTVVKTRIDYVREGMEHLSDTRTYKKLDRDYTPDVVEHINYTLHQCKRGGLLSDHTNNAHPNHTHQMWSST